MVITMVVRMQRRTQKVSEGGAKFRHNRVTSQTSFAFAKTAWFCFTFLGSEGGPWHSGLPPWYASARVLLTAGQLFL